MPFVLKSSEGILKDGTQFMGSDPPVGSSESESTSPEDLQQSPMESAVDTPMEMEDSPADRDEITIDPNFVIKTEPDVPILEGVSLDQDSVGVTSPSYDDTGNDQDHPTVNEDGDPMYTNYSPADTFTPAQVASMMTSEVISFQGNETDGVEQNGYRPANQFDTYRVIKHHDQKMGMYFICPKCFQKYVSFECVQEHVEKYCPKGTISSSRLLHPDLKQKESPPSPRQKVHEETIVDSDDSNSSDDSDEDPDFNLGEMKRQRRQFLNCQYCSRRFTNAAGLRAHERLTHTPGGKIQRGPVKCTFCDKILPFKHVLRKHLQHVHAVPSAELNKWVAESPSGNSIATDNDTKSPICNEGDEESYSCQVCPSQFSDVDDLNNHSLGHLMEAEKQFKCSFCDKTFMFQPMLDEHEKIHASDFQYSCFVCGEFFSKERLLEQHYVQSPQCSPDAV